MTKDEISNALDDPDWRVHLAAIQHSNATSKHIDKALNDPNAYVRVVAIKHPKVTSKQDQQSRNLSQSNKVDNFL